MSIDTSDVICYPPMGEPPFSFQTLRDSNPPYDTPTSLLVFGDHGTVQGIGFLVSEKMIEDFAKHGNPTAGTIGHAHFEKDLRKWCASLCFVCELIDCVASLSSRKGLCSLSFSGFVAGDITYAGIDTEYASLPLTPSHSLPLLLTSFPLLPSPSLPSQCSHVWRGLVL